jgi:enoyl-CoA hydratase/3-hydroxyacyl-CoA dehydrogenase
MIVGVIGSGAIGPDLAYGFISAIAGEEGSRLFLHDIREDALATGTARIEGYMDKGLSRGKLSPKKVASMRSGLTPTLDISDLSECDYVLEAATEDLAVKRVILKDLEAVVRDDCLIGFATSGIPRALIASETVHPERCFVNHPFYPAWRALPMEVVLSGDETFGTRMIATLRRLGKVPLVTADVPCFAADDVFCNYCAEAARIVAEGLATPAQVDRIVDDAIGGGGPLNVLDLTGGNALCVHCLELMEEAATGSEWFAPPPILTERVDASWHDPGDPADSVYDEALGKVVLDRILAVLVGRSYFVVDNDICDPSDLNWLSRNALGFRRGLLDLADDLGGDRLHSICTTYADANPGFEVPQSILEKNLAVFYRNLIIDIQDDIAVITIRRPEVMNALNDQTVDEIAAAIEELDDDDRVSGIVLTSFDGSIAGADIMELAALKTPEEAVAKCQRGHAALNRVSATRKPVVAALDGPVLGGGSELAMACHGRVVGTRLMLGQPEVNLGIIPGYGGTQRLPRLIGLGRALEMLRSGSPVRSSEAFEWGWATVEPVTDIVDAARGLIRQHLAGEDRLAPVDPDPLEVPAELPAADIGHRSLVIDSILLAAVRDGLRQPLVEGLAVEAEAFGRCRQTLDYDIGMKNFIQNGPRVPAVFLNE